MTVTRVCAALEALAETRTCWRRAPVVIAVHRYGPNSSSLVHTRLSSRAASLGVGRVRLALARMRRAGVLGDVAVGPAVPDGQVQGRGDDRVDPQDRRSTLSNTFVRFMASGFHGVRQLREGPDGDQLRGWPKTMRVFARRERPHPGAQLSRFRGRRRLALLPVGHQPARRAGPGGEYAYIDAAHRGCARVGDVIRTGRQDRDISPPMIYGLNKGWLYAAMTACILLSWLKFLALGGGNRHRLAARPGHPHPHLTRTNPPRRATKEPGACGTPGRPAR